MKIFNPAEPYWVTGDYFQRLQTVAKTLYREERLNGDQMRDLAQAVDSAIAQAEPVPVDARPNRCQAIALKIARHVFARRGNHSEAHMTETELAAALALAAELGARGR